MRYYQNINHIAAQRLINNGSCAGRWSGSYRSIGKNYATCRILDVRDPEEYAAGHLPGAINVPLHQVGRKVPYLMPNRHKPLLVYCGSGARSLPAVQVLSVMGYQNLYNLYKGIDSWPYPLVRE